MSVTEDPQQQQQSFTSGQAKHFLNSSSTTTATMTATAVIDNRSDNDNSPSMTSTVSSPANDVMTATNNDNNSGSSSSSVMVAVRIRPLLALEAGADRCLEVLHTQSSSSSSTRKSPFSSSSSAANHKIASTVRIGGSAAGIRFTFDHVYDSTALQDDIYVNSVVPLVQCALQGFNATILAYGQTGSGKTFTMMGEDSNNSDTTSILNSSAASLSSPGFKNTVTSPRWKHHPMSSPAGGSSSSSTAGIIPRALKSLFDALEHEKQQFCTDNSGSNNNISIVSYDYTVRLQFLELYGEDIRDLLCSSCSNNRLTIRDVGGGTGTTGEPEVVGATQLVVESSAEALQKLHAGMLRRVTGATAMNQSSSRSHAILSVSVEQTTTTTAASATRDPSDNDDQVEEHTQIKRSKFNFVDLAGSERQKKTLAVGQRLKEGIDINKGLLVLGNVISALGDPKKRGRTFVPYRDSKLTRLLKGSLGGNHKTLMIACVSPADTNLEESLSCLRYANRAKNIQNNAVVNVDNNSRKIAVLQSQVQQLAVALLERMNGKISREEPTRQVLEALVKSAGAVDGIADAAAATTSGVGINNENTANGTSAVTPRKIGFEDETRWSNNHIPGVSPPPPPATVESTRFQELEAQLQRARHELRQTQMNHDSAEEQLYVAKAEKELFQLQLSVFTTMSPNHKNASKNNTHPDQQQHHHHEMFLNKAKEYEKEISRLRGALCTAEAKLSTQASSSMDWLAATSSSSPGWHKAQSSLEEDRERLEQLQLALSSESNDDKHEEQAEEAQVQELTQRYLQASGYREDEEDDEASREGADGGGQEEEEDVDLPDRNFQADLIELSRSIAAKEELIDQLKLSQEKYATMRGFYEEKLKQMESALAEREAEREHLLQQLQQAKEGDVAGKEQLEDRLREKNEHIAGLRQKHKQLKDLTAISARNSDDIDRLQNDVKEMKRRKVDLQKLLTRERKEHAAELKRLQKEAIQKDRELSKMKQFNARKEEEARRANNIAKTRLDELGHLRTKYKDTEKKLRLMSVKHGVMAKAGIDPVLVGRRAMDNKRSQKKSPTSNKNLDSDVMRDYFDKRVASVVRKEALADKLAHEWEEHFELTTRLEQLKEHREEENGEDTTESITMQVRFKEDRIRRLVQRLGSQGARGGGETGKEEANNLKSFLFDSEFAKICHGADSGTATDAAAKVLFGMVVRERRRVAALARSASSLDERLQAAEKAATVSEEALRTYMDEQDEERAILSQNQQEQLLSLMDVVKDVSEGTYGESGMEPSQQGVFDSTMLLLANERIATLEQQLHELRLQSSAQDTYREKAEELEQSLQCTSQEYDMLQKDNDGLRNRLRRIREEITKQGDGCLGWTVLDIVNEALHPMVTKRRNKSTRTTRGNFENDSKFRVPALNVAKETSATIESAENSASEIEELHDWAKDIMDDLALIAKGEVPPSLEHVAKESSVFDRLSDPQSFTGTQKLVREGKKQSPSNDRRALAREISDRLEQIVVPEDVSSSILNHTPSNESIESAGKDSGSEGKTYKSVFDRLISPSHYTGTQRGKHKGKAKGGKGSDNSTRKILDGVLEGNESKAMTDGKRKDSKDSGGDRTDYTQQDVFERLQKTTTQAYAVKHCGTLVPDGHHLDESVTHASKHGEEKREAADSQREASKSPASHPLGAKQEETRSHVQPDYTQQNVFERLQKTTTEAYAKKTSKAKKEQLL